MAFWESLGSWELEARYDLGLDQADSVGLRSAARTYLSPERRSTAWIVPN
jgi:hypothetical protein